MLGLLSGIRAGSGTSSAVGVARSAIDILVSLGSGGVRFVSIH